jgi:hypothetical protein
LFSWIKKLSQSGLNCNPNGCFWIKTLIQGDFWDIFRGFYIISGVLGGRKPTNQMSFFDFVEQKAYLAKSV